MELSNGLIKSIRPEARPLRDFYITYDDQGNKILAWISSKDEPTAEELEAAWLVYDKNAEEKAAKDNAITTERDRRIAAGVTYNGVVYQSRATDRENIAGAAQLALMATLAGNGAAGDYRWHGGDSDFVWIAADNSLVKMDAPTVIAFAKTAAAAKQAYTMLARSLKDMEAMTDDITDDSLWQI